MIKNRMIIFVVISLLLAGCQSVSLDTQQATATAFANESMVEAMLAAEVGAMALCEIDFDEDPSLYIDSICALSTSMSCLVVQDEVTASWEDMQRAYTSQQVTCTKSTSRLLEEGQQFGMRVQYWKVNLNGIQGFAGGNKNREYWLQVAEENGSWKFNRLLTSGEAALYLAIDEMDGE